MNWKTIHNDNQNMSLKHPPQRLGDWTNQEIHLDWDHTSRRFRFNLCGLVFLDYQGSARRLVRTTVSGVYFFQFSNIVAVCWT